MSPDGRGPVVVAVDDAGSAGDAVDWASAEAATRGCPLRIVHAVLPPLPTDPFGVSPPIDHGEVREAGRRVLREAVARAEAVASDIEVSARMLRGAPARALIEEAADGRLLVLGHRGLCGLRGLLAGSVSAQVVARSSCPVVVIRPRPAGPRSGFEPPRVVVGVDAAGSCTTAVGFAFRAARQRGLPLTAVHAWTPDRPADLEGTCGPPAMAAAVAGRTLERALDRWRPEFADVPVLTSLVPCAPAPALIAASRGAALVVVGSRGRGHVLGRVLGSVSQAVLRHGPGPLAIIRQDGAPTARPPAAHTADQVPRRDGAPGHRRGSGRRRNGR